MPNELPDRLTVALQVMQRFRDSGQPYSPQDIERATEETLHTIRQQHFANMPRGMAMYEYEGKESSAGFLKRMVHTASTMGHNLVAGSVGSALSMSDSDWAVKASEDMRSWAHEKVAENVARDPELQAYYAWKEDEPSWSGFDTTMRAMSEVIPSLAASISGTVLGVAAAPLTGGSSLATAVVSLTPMFLLENSSHYIEQMDLMVDEMGMSPEEANEYAGMSALTYGIFAAMLERVGARAMMKGVPGLKQMVPEKAMMRKITESLIESGAKKSALGNMGMRGLARLTNVIEKAMIEGGTEWSQAMAEAVSMYATEHDFKDSADFFNVLGQEMFSEGVLEQAYGGGVMGIPFGMFIPGGSKAISSRQFDKTMERVKEKSKAGGFDEVVEEGTPDYLNNYLAAIVNPRERMGSFLEDFEASDDKISQAIDKVKGDTSYSSAILRLIKEDPTVVAAIENHPDRDRLLKLAAQKLNKQKPQERQIDVENTDEMINAVKMFAEKGNITQADKPADLTQSEEEPSIDWSGDLIDQTPNESLFYPQVDEEIDVEEEPPDIEPTEEEISRGQKIFGGFQQKKVETQEERKVNVGKTGVVETGVYKGKKVSILAAAAKMYKVQELDDAGQTTGPQIYVYPNQINIGEEAQAQEVVEPKKITAKVMKDFISTGVVSPGILQHIANKIADNKKLTKNEEAIRSDKSAEIESLLKKEVAPEKTEEVSDELTKEDLLGKEEAVEPETQPELKSDIAKKGERVVDEIVDIKNRVLTYFAKTTVAKDGTKTTKFTFNRSDKSKDQRNPAGVSPIQALEAVEGDYEYSSDDLREGEALNKVYEIREGKTGAAATVEFVNVKDGTKTRAEVRLETKEDITAEDVIGKPAVTPATPIKFKEVKKAGYVARTRSTGQEADLTLDFAKTPKGSGATKRNAKNYKNIKISQAGDVLDNVEASILIARQLTDGKIVNIAGHGIYGLNADQSKIDSVMKEIFDRVIDFSKKTGKPITGKVITGGQTGFDEAGAKAASSVGIETEVVAPKGYLYRIDDGYGGIDVRDEAGFKARFDIKAQPESDVEALAGVIGDEIIDEDIKDLDADLPPGTPDVNQPIEDLTELEDEINVNQTRAEQTKKNYIIDGEAYQRVSNVIGTAYTGREYPDAIKAGNIVDGLVRSFFTEGDTPVHNDQEITKESFDSLMKALGAVKEQIDKLGLRVMSNNIITWDDASGVAGEIDLLVLNPKTGKIQIWDIKTSKSKSTSKAYDRKWKGNDLERSKRDQHSIQLSAYKRLIENQYGIEVEKIAIFPFYIGYNKAGRIKYLEKEKGITLEFNKSFTDTIIPPNKMSANISNVVPEAEVTPDVESMADVEAVDPEEPSDAEMENMANTLLGRMADPKTDEEKGYDTDQDVEINDDDDQTFFQEEESSRMPKIVDNPELAKKIVSRLRKHFGDYITDDTFEGTLEDNGRKVVGVAFRNIAMWSKTDATIDTMPHEYAHVYVSLMRETSLVRRGIKYFGSEEKLVQHIGEYYANRIQNKTLLQRIKIWLRQFANTLKNIFSNIPDEFIADYLAEEFYLGKWEGGWETPRKGSQYDAYLKYQPQQPIDEEGIAQGVPTHSSSAKDSPSDLHIKEFFHKVFGVHIEKAQVPVLMKLARDNDSFDDYLVAIKSWAKDQAKEKTYRVNIRTDYSSQELNQLRDMYLKDRHKLYRYVKGEKEGLDTRVHWTLILPTNKSSSPRVDIAPLERLDTGSKEPQSHIRNFVEEDIKKGHHNKKIIFLRMRDIVNEWFSEEKNKNVYWRANTKLTENLLNKVETSNIKKYIRQIVKYGKDKANLLVTLGVKGGDNDAILFGNASKDFSNLTPEQFENYLNEEVKEKRMKKTQRDVILEEWIMSDEKAAEYAIEAVNRKDVMEVVPLKEGETIKQAKLRVAKILLPSIKAIPFAQVVSIHEYMKSIKYNKYAMNEKHILDTYTRLSIDLSEGYSPKTKDNSLASEIMVVPNDTIIRARSKETGELIPIPSGQDVKTFDNTDGQTMSGSAWMNRLGDNIGTPNLGAIKTSIRHRSKDGEHYIGMKHLQMVPFNNLEFYKQGSDIPFARVAEYEGETYFEKLDKNGNVVGVFHHIGSNNEAKQTSGKFSEYYKLNDINESDVKVILNPPKSSDTAAHPVALGEILLDPSVLANKDTPEAMELAKQIMKHYADYDSKGRLQGGVAKEYLDMLRSMRNNPKTFLAAVRRTLDEGRIPTEAEKWIEILEKTEGEGIHHKYITNLFVSYLNNIYFSNGLFKSRKMGKGNATHGYLKPNLYMGIADGSVAVSAQNTTVYKKAIKHWAKVNEHLRLEAESRGEKLSAFKLFNRYTRRMNGNEKIDVLNEALSQQELHVLIHRQPIAKVTGVVTRRVQMLVAGNHGDTIFLNESDVTEVLDGDYDGDHGFLEFIEGDLLDAYESWQASDTFAEKDKVVAVPMFGEKLEDTSSDVTYLSREARNSAVVGQASASGSQGRITNAKTVMTQLAYKNIKLYVKSLEGGFISARKPGDSTVMDYIPLDIKQLNKNDGELLRIIVNNKDMVVDENGDPVIPSRTDTGGFSIRSRDDVFLQTTVEHELAILLQMSVDNKKFGLLSKLGWDNDFMLRRIFQRSDGEELNTANIHTLRLLFKVQNFSGQRQGRTESRNVASMNRIVEDSSTLAERFFDPETGERISKEKSGEQYVAEFVAAMKRQRFRYKGEYPEKISTNGSITPGEVLISSVGREYNKLINQIESAEQAGSHFLDWADKSYQISHQRAINELGNIPNWFDADAWSNKELLEAYEYLVLAKYDQIDKEGNPTGKLISLNKKFWDIYKNAARDDETPIHISADYNTELSKFVDDHIDEWLSLSERTQELVSALFLKGVGDRTNILTLMPLDLMSPAVVEEFIPVFTKHLKSLSDTDFVKQAGEVKAQPGYKKLQKLVTKAYELYEHKAEQVQINCKR